MERPIYITPNEHARLMRLATGRPITTSFGPSGVWLQEKAGEIVSAWAVPLLEEWRGLTVQEGAGI